MIYVTEITPYIHVSRSPLSDRDMVALKDQGFQLIVNLEEKPRDKIEIETIHSPIRFGQLPRKYQLKDLLHILRRSEQLHRKTLIHCAAGLGHSAVVAACYMVQHLHMNGYQAIDELRRLRPGAVETKDQEETILVFAEKMREKRQKEAAKEEAERVEQQARQTQLDRALKKKKRNRGSSSVAAAVPATATATKSRTTFSLFRQSTMSRDRQSQIPCDLPPPPIVSHVDTPRSPGLLPPPPPGLLPPPPLPPRDPSDIETLPAAPPKMKRSLTISSFSTRVKEQSRQKMSQSTFIPTMQNPDQPKLQVPDQTADVHQDQQSHPNQESQTEEKMTSQQNQAAIIDELQMRLSARAGRLS